VLKLHNLLIRKGSVQFLENQLHEACDLYDAALQISEELCQAENWIFSTGPTRELTPPPQFSHALLHNPIFVAASSGELCLAKAAR
jgi:hypothetical protein